MVAKDQAKPAQDSGKDDTPSKEKSFYGFKLSEMLDIAGKLIAASAVIATTIIADRYQSSLATANLLVQREQSDSQLRASMFSTLIGPFVGADKVTEDISTEKEQLLVELLALNFHEHFELKPLMIHLDNRLAKVQTSNPDLEQKKRDSLNEIAQLVVQRQLATLMKADNESSPEHNARIDYFKLTERNQECSKQEYKPNESSPMMPCTELAKLDRHFDDLFGTKSPNGQYILHFTISPPSDEDWKNILKNQRFTVNVNISKNDDKHTLPITEDTIIKSKLNYNDLRAMLTKDFLLTWFDVPYANNTLLADGTRFSMLIDSVEPTAKMVKLKIVWFPQDYFAAQERPTNYSQFREKLGLKLSK